MKKMYLTGIIVSGLLCMSSCSKNEDDKAANITVYGQPYELASGIFYESTSYNERTTIPYIFEDKYVDESGKPVTDRVEGFAMGQDTKVFGNFMFSLYEKGMVFNEVLGQITGRGVCLCFHLASAEKDRLVPGKYVYNAEREKNTFVAYFSSDYNPEKSVKPAIISEGEVNIEQSGDMYHVQFDCKTSFGGVITGTYDGAIRQVKVSSQQSANWEGVVLGGAMSYSHVAQYMMGMLQAEQDTPDVYTSAFFSTAFGSVSTAEADGKKNVDIALIWDRDKNVFRFESPIRMRSLLWHMNDYDHPCHTIYMPAPDTFTDKDFENLDTVGFDFEVEDKPIVIGVNPFKKSYVFFQTGYGVKGVLRLNNYFPMETVKMDIVPGMMYMTYEVGAKLLIDVKSEASFHNPVMR